MTVIEAVLQLLIKHMNTNADEADKADASAHNPGANAEVRDEVKAQGQIEADVEAEAEAGVVAEERGEGEVKGEVEGEVKRELEDEVEGSSEVAGAKGRDVIEQVDEGDGGGGSGVASGGGARGGGEGVDGEGTVEAPDGTKLTDVSGASEVRILICAPRYITSYIYKYVGLGQGAVKIMFFLLSSAHLAVALLSLPTPHHPRAVPCARPLDRSRRTATRPPT